MSIINFLFRGSWGMLSKPIFWFLGGWILCGILEGGSSDGVSASSWAVGIAGTILGVFSLWLSLGAEK